MTIQVFYTDSDKVRGALGVTAREISDEQIENLSVADQIEFALSAAYPAHEALKDKISNDSASPTEKTLWKAILLFCQYSGAVSMTPQLQMLTAQKITDGDAEMQRFMKDNLEDTIARITVERNKWLSIVTAAVPGAVAAGAIVHFGTVQPGYDPVTNTGTNPSPSGT